MKITMLRRRYLTLNFQVVSKGKQLGHCPCLTNSPRWKTLIINAPHPLTKDEKKKLYLNVNKKNCSIWLAFPQSEETTSGL